jgi:hypothetical protein
MKKPILRYAVITIVLAGAISIFAWYWMMKREVPAHARVIPSNVIAVMTLNVRELAKDHTMEEIDFAETTFQDAFFAPFIRVIESSEGETGVNELSDVLAFTYHTDDAAFIGAAVAVEDSAAFGNLIRQHLAREFNILALSHDGIPVFQFDTTAAAFGWTEDVAVLLYPLGDHTIATVSAQCLKLLKQQKENSVLANENFCNMQLKSFAAGLWVQTAPLLLLTEGGPLIEAIAQDVVAYSYTANFEDGEILIQSEWLLADDNKREMIREFEFPCDTTLMISFVRGHFNTKTTSLPEHSFADLAILNLPIAEEEYPTLFSGMTGDFISITNVDNGAAKRFETHSFLLSDPEKTKSFITSSMQRDSIPLTVKGWMYSAAGDSAWRMILDGNRLTITNHSDVDGRPHPITPDLAGYMAWVNFHNYATSHGAGSSLFPLLNTGTPLLDEYLLNVSSTLPVQFGNVRHSEIVVRFKNKNVNALVQTETILNKSLGGN